MTWQTITPDDQGKSEGSFSFGVNKDPGAQPTAAPAGAAKPSTLPKTGEIAPNLTGYFLAAAALLMAAGLVLLRSRKRA